MPGPQQEKDRLLGMQCPINRRDFLHGTAVTGLGLASAALFGGTGTDMPARAPQDTDGYYPPGLTGMRGSHPGSFEDAHAARDGREWAAPIDTGERYDLIVVGGGISGLSAAYFYRELTSKSGRVLVLDNHDDFGGHAKRNEFVLDGRLQLMNGGTLEIDSPRPYGPVAAALLKNLGIDVASLIERTQDTGFYGAMGLGKGVFFDRETFGADRLLVGMEDADLLRSLARAAPLSDRARRDILRIETEQHDYMPRLSSAEKKLRLSRISYDSFLTEIAHVEPSVLKYYQARTKGEWGVGTDAVSALDCWGFGLPGFQGLGLTKGSIARMGFTPAGYEDTGGSLRLHFPDGNATIARLLVRDLVPRAVPGNSVEDVVTSRVNYAALDEPGAPVRLRLNSTVVRARHLDEDRSRGLIEVTYRRGGATLTARARGVVLACYNMMIPYLCPELPRTQREALHALVKTPLVYTTVSLRNWQSFVRLKVQRVYAPGSYHSYFHLNSHVDIGAYQSSRSPDDPILIHMVRTPGQPGLPEHEQNRAGRTELLSTSFATFERNIRDQLARTLSGGGFDPARDITGITVNRWPHGYAPEYNPLFDPELPEQARPQVVGRTPFGRITIANSDAGGGAYTDVAIEQADRAVRELIAVGG